MTQPAKVQEPSMEEILASIRRIIADDEAKPPAGDTRCRSGAHAGPRKAGKAGCGCAGSEAGDGRHSTFEDSGGGRRVRKKACRARSTAGTFTSCACGECPQQPGRYRCSVERARR